MKIFILLVILYFIFYRYLENLRKENCECALNKDYELIKKITLITIFCYLIFVLMIFNINIKSKILSYIYIFITFIIPIIIIICMYLLNKYIYNLKNYECSKSIIKTIIFYNNVIWIFINSLFLLYAVLHLIIFINIFIPTNKSKTKIKK